MDKWSELKFWNSGEWQVIQEKLDTLDDKGEITCPLRQNLFAALDSVAFEDVRVMILGQDPYPNLSHATGIAFDVPSTVQKLPPTLLNIFREYKDDLHYPPPTSGSLTTWTQQGVLLWNCIPCCSMGRSLSQKEWTEWSFLTREIIEQLANRYIVFVFMGTYARSFIKYVPEDKKSSCIEIAHPASELYRKFDSRRAPKHPFFGSRLFSSINQKLNDQGLEPIDWRLE